MLRTESVQYRYDDNLNIEFPDFQLGENESSLLLGKSGSGKTTLTHLLAGILPLQTGNILFKEQEYSHLNNLQMDKLRATEMGVILQQPQFIGALNLLENMQMNAFYRKVKFSIDHYKNIAEQLNIEHLLYQKTYKMSSGEKQRASIALAIENKPKLILADEPTSNLDDENCEKVVGIFKNIQESYGASLLIVTHDQRLKNHFKHIIQL